MWITLIEEPYERRSEFNEMPRAADTHAGDPSRALCAADWNAILLSALAPFREAREAVKQAVQERLAQLQFSPSPA